MKEEMAALQQSHKTGQVPTAPKMHNRNYYAIRMCFLHNVTAVVLTADRQPCFHYRPAGRTWVKAFRWQLGINSIIIA